MNFISVCAGIEAISQACHGLNWNPLLYSEIDKFPRSVLKRRYRAVDQRKYKNEAHSGRPVLWGDFTALRPRHLRRMLGHADVDLLAGGTPCQSFSVAGGRAGLDDPRGDLALEFALLAFRLGVRWILWENVPGVFSSAEGKDFAAILSAFTGREVEVPEGGWRNSGIIEEAGPGHFGICWRVLDAQFAGVPQRRRRVILVGHLGDWRRAAAVLFERHSLSGNPAPRREKGQVAPTLSSRRTGGGGLGGDFDYDGGLVASTGDVSHCLNAGGMGRQDFETETLLAVGGFPDVAHALRADGFDASEDGTGRGTPLVPVAIQAGALRENPNSGPDGVGVQEDIAYTLEARAEVQAVAFDCKASGRNGFAVGDVSPTLRSMGHTDSHQNAGGQVAVMTLAVRGRGGEPTLEVRDDGIANAVLTPNGVRAGMGVGAVAISANQRGEIRERDVHGSLSANKSAKQFDGVMQGMAVRRLTPVECERLQGFPDNFTLVKHRGKMAADGPRYKALGNSMAVPVFRWVCERIQMVEDLLLNNRTS